MRTLVAGVGNIFLSDDGFGSEVVRRLEQAALPADVRVMDIGIRGIHLAHELLEGYDALVLIDAVPAEEEPGTVSVLEVDRSTPDDEGVPFPGVAASFADAHGFDPETTLRMVEAMGGELGRVYVVGCQPADVSEGIGLSAQVAAAVEQAASATVELVTRLHAPDGSAAAGKVGEHNG